MPLFLTTKEVQINMNVSNEIEVLKRFRLPEDFFIPASTF